MELLRYDPCLWLRTKRHHFLYHNWALLLYEEFKIPPQLSHGITGMVITEIRIDGLSFFAFHVYVTWVNR
jgi:hypothetical protein